MQGFYEKNARPKGKRKIFIKTKRARPCKS